MIKLTNSHLHNNPKSKPLLIYNNIKTNCCQFNNGKKKSFWRGAYKSSFLAYIFFFWGSISPSLGIASEGELKWLKGALIFSPSLNETYPFPMNDHLNGNLGNTEISALKQKIELNPINAQLHYELGYKYAVKGDYTKSILQLKSAIELKPVFVKAMVTLGLVYFNQEKYQKSEKILLDALAIECDNIDALYGLVILYYYGQFVVRDRFDKAISFLRKALKLQPKNFSLHQNFAEILEKECFYGRNELCQDSTREWQTVIKLIKFSQPKDYAAQSEEAEKHIEKLKDKIKTVAPK